MLSDLLRFAIRITAVVHEATFVTLTGGIDDLNQVRKKKETAARNTEFESLLIK
jgi:hypothetical protein